MRKYFTAFIGFAILAFLITAICLLSFEPVDSLLKPPMSDGENREIQLAFEEAVNKKFKVRVPLNGDYRAAYIFEDLNGDFQDEVIVFYSTEDALDVVRMNYMAKINQQWKSVADVESAYSEVQQVEFSDLDNDGVMEILVGWAIYQNDLSRNLNVYKLPEDNNGELKSILSCPYSDFETVDIDYDGVEDIAVFESIDNTPSYVQLSFNTFDSGEIIKKSSIVLDSSVYSVLKLTHDYSEQYGFTRLFVDGYKIDSGVITECIYWDSYDGTLKKIKSDNNVSVLSSRMTNIACEDVDNDGLIDVPIEVPIKGSEVISDSKNESYTQTVIRWMQISPRSNKTVTHQLIYGNNEFRISFNDEWVDGITVKNDYTTGSIYFYSTQNDITGLLFELKYVTTQNEEDLLPSKYKLLTETSRGKLFYIIYNADRNLMINKIFLEKAIVC